MQEYRVLLGEKDVFSLGEPVKTLGTMYIAYREIAGPITAGRGRILLPCSEEYYENVKQQIQPYSVIRVMADFDGATFQAENLLEISAQPSDDERTFLELQALPVTIDDPQFGVFTLDKTIFVFSGSIDVEGMQIDVLLESDAGVETLRQIYPDIKQLVAEAGLYAAEELLEGSNDYGYDAWASEISNAEDLPPMTEDDFNKWMDENRKGESYIPLTVDDFTKRISLQSILVTEDGSLSLEFDDGDLFWGHRIIVESDPTLSFIDASI